MTPEELDKLWGDPVHWTAWSYNCVEDPRMVVPKRNPVLGWTINAAHPRAAFMAFFMLAVCFVPLLIVFWVGFSIFFLLMAVTFSSALLMGSCFYLSRPPE